ncbi:MAG: hypothetical protein VCA55_06325, partial [Verrucomicrobiales bacterium]
MERTFIFLAAWLIASAFAPSKAADLSDLSYTTTGGAVTITDCNQAASGELVIPDTIEGNPATTSPCLENRDKMRSLHNIATAIAICLVLLPAKLSHAGEDVRDWRFVDITGKKHAPFDSKETKALVAVFICTDCPIANYFQPTLRKMAEKYAAQGVRFVLV